MLKKKVIVRGDRSGVFFGTLESKNGREVILSNVRKIWKWEGAAAVEQISVDGVANKEESKFTVVVESIEITDAIQILPCTEKAIANLESVAEWKN
jgi:FMN-dependent NADH-azoreductase